MNFRNGKKLNYQFEKLAKSVKICYNKDRFSEVLKKKYLKED